MMSVSSYYLVRSIKLGSLKNMYMSTSLTKRNYSCFTGKKERTCFASADIDCHPVFKDSRRTLRKYAAAIGGMGSGHLNPKYRADKIGKEFEFVYGSPNTRWYIYWIPMIYIVITVISVICGQIIYTAYWLEEDVPTGSPIETSKMTIDSVDPVTATFIILPLMFIVLCSVLHYTRSNLLRLYYNERSNKFVAVALKYGLYKEKVHFNPRDVKLTAKVGLKGNVSIKGNRYLVCEKNFTSTRMYNICMGYDVARPSEYQQQMENEDIRLTFQRLAKQNEKNVAERFVKEYQEKRKKKK